MLRGADRQAAAHRARQIHAAADFAADNGRPANDGCGFSGAIMMPPWPFADII